MAGLGGASGSLDQQRSECWEHRVGRRAAHACFSDPGDDLDPGLVHRLEPLSLLLRILVWDGADEVMLLAQRLAKAYRMQRHRRKPGGKAGGRCTA
jgi:hypothetical protein